MLLIFSPYFRGNNTLPDTTSESTEYVYEEKTTTEEEEQSVTWKLLFIGSRHQGVMITSEQKAYQKPMVSPVDSWDRCITFKDEKQHSKELVYTC